MGLSLSSARVLLYYQTLGVSFKRVATIGRQELLASAGAMSHAFKQWGQTYLEQQDRCVASQSRRYAEPLFQSLGAKEIIAFDNSDFEGAERVWDFNRDLPDPGDDRFDFVLDGGSLEHIFNFPVAVANCMRLVKLGGCFASITPANNYLGHGFYQFSPELMFRIFCAENGFALLNVLIMEDRNGAPWYEVTDPAILHKRVTLQNCKPVLMYVLARKVTEVPLFSIVPQQSDYATIWKTASELGASNNDMTRLSESKLARSVQRRLERVRATNIGALTSLAFRSPGLRRLNWKRMANSSNGRQK
jgi:SAM-dependent methyltransferase